MRDLITIEDNKTVLAALIAKKQNMVPFIGAGFSATWCPTWDTFRENFFNSLKNKSLLKLEEWLTGRGAESVQKTGTN